MLYCSMINPSSTTGKLLKVYKKKDFPQKIRKLNTEKHRVEKKGGPSSKMEDFWRNGRHPVISLRWQSLHQNICTGPASIERNEFFQQLVISGEIASPHLSIIQCIFSVPNWPNLSIEGRCGLHYTFKNLQTYIYPSMD